MFLRKSKKLKRLLKIQTVVISITVDIANTNTDTDALADINNVDNNTYTIPALSAMLIKTTASTNIAQEELCVSDSDKEQECLNNTAIFFNNYSNKGVSSTEIQTADDPATLYKNGRE